MRRRDPGVVPGLRRRPGGCGCSVRVSGSFGKDAAHCPFSHRGPASLQQLRDARTYLSLLPPRAALSVWVRPELHLVCVRKHRPEPTHPRAGRESDRDRVGSQHRVANRSRNRPMLRDPAAGLARCPRSSLVAFEKIEIAPGDRVTVKFVLRDEALRQVDGRGERVRLPGNYRIVVGSASPGRRAQTLGAPTPLFADFTLVPDAPRAAVGQVPPSNHVPST